jgi:putative drug exporter of the RND superfamily
MERWTLAVLRYRWPILAAWLAILAAGLVAFLNLSGHLSTSFAVPGTDSERARSILGERFHDRSDGRFTVVFRSTAAMTPDLRAELEQRVRRAAAVVPGGFSGDLERAGPHVAYGAIGDSLRLTRAKSYTDAVRTALRPLPPGVEAFVTGQPAIQHDLDPIFARDLAKGESIALPVSLLVLLAVFGLSVAVTMPFLFAACTIMATLGIVWGFAHFYETATYVTNLVQLVGLGIAIDYSLLVVYRFREELAHEDDVQTAIVRTMQTAGRAVIFSGATVAVGLTLLLFMPLPFMRSMGVGGFLIPVISIVAAATLQPVLLSFYGRRGTRRVRVLPERRRPKREFWGPLAARIMRRPLAFLVPAATVMLVAALPVFWLALTPGSAGGGVPRSPEAIRGFDVLQRTVGPGAVAPVQAIVDTGRRGGVLRPGIEPALTRFVIELNVDPEVGRVTFRPEPPFVDRTGRYLRVSIVTRHDYGDPEAQAFARRLRSTLVPNAAFPAGVTVLAGGSAPTGIDFLDRAYGVFPWLVGGVLLLTFLILMRAFRSWLLPVKAVLLNLLSVAATYGLLVVTFKWGAGSVFGLDRYPQVEGWIPIFLFAILFGLSMDYEVFLVSRMREEWDRVHDNERAVSLGLERTGRIITAAAAIMVAAFLGLAAGSIVGLQELGIGLAFAVLLDATVVRAILVPSLMALLGNYNWWLPARVARLLRVAPSPLEATR